jgi:protein-disulfide isomerase
MTIDSPQLLTVPVSDHDHVRGSLDAPLVLVEYADFECPYCGAAYGELQVVQRELGDQLALVFRNFPLVQSHRHALQAAEAAEAAGAQDRFWPMHDLLFEHQDALDRASLVEYATAVGVADVGRFVRDLDDHRYVDRIRADLESGDASGVQGTPTFFINGVRHEGSFDSGSLLRALADAGRRR